MDDDFFGKPFLDHRVQAYINSLYNFSYPRKEYNFKKPPREEPTFTRDGWYENGESYDKNIFEDGKGNKLYMPYREYEGDFYFEDGYDDALDNDADDLSWRDEKNINHKYAGIPRFKGLDFRCMKCTHGNLRFIGTIPGYDMQKQQALSGDALLCDVCRSRKIIYGNRLEDMTL